MILAVWLEFAACAAAIGVAGTQLSRYGDAIADKTGLGGTWIGMVLLATVTSLPELATGLSAVTLVDAPNLAVGDALGSCVFNLLLILVLDAMHRPESIYSRAGQGHILAAGFGIVMIGWVGFNLVLGPLSSALAVGHVGLYSPVIVVLYVVAMRTVFQYERAQIGAYAEAAPDRYPHLTLRGASLRYAAAAAAVVAAGLWLPFIGRQLAEVMGWHTTFVGSLFLAFATSVPELVVTVAALRLGALDMAIGNLLGSNLFDVLVIAIDDMAYTRGPILAHVSPAHAASAVSAMVMSAVAVIALLYRPRTRLLRTVGWASLTLLTVYLLNAYVLFLFGD